MTAAITPPQSVVSAVKSLIESFDDIHVMHEHDDSCPEDCDEEDYSEGAYQDHDEHNADVRETIHERAEALVEALTEWLGSAVLG